MNFTDEQIQRYSRHIILSEVGGKGQKKIREAKVFV
ncbi:MAG: adenylyltransferase, partial [Nitrospirae bacterium]|nr:adenylyltransferase [Nitrospirota bacterium]